MWSPELNGRGLELSAEVTALTVLDLARFAHHIGVSSSTRFVNVQTCED